MPPACFAPLASLTSLPLAGIEASFQSTDYKGEVYVGFNNKPTTITIRPHNAPSKILDLSVVAKIGLSLLLVYPAVALVESVWAPHYNHLRSSIPLTRWRCLPTTPTSSPHTPASAKALAAAFAPRPPKVAHLPGSNGKGEWVYLMGTQEGEWSRKWERAIKVGVQERIRGGRVLREEDGEREGGARAVLKGYHEEGDNNRVQLG